MSDIFFDEFEIECMECGWQGYYNDLVDNDDDSEVCPRCGAVDNFENITHD